MIGKRTRRHGLVLILAATAALTSACGSVEAEDVPGVFHSDETGASITLGADSTFTATGVAPDDVSGSGGADPVDFSGTWEFVNDFVYLTVDDGGLGKLAGVQLYPDGVDEVEFRADPDGPPSLEFTRVATP
ncbi:lipocalin family protein [Phytomonospora endophytica]|uniref:Secreted protein n=1 Tax=Phytomonospora endophytica TaxID=714109 RepID=A0A841FNP9_9ACTN|nr:lipocalin family protein [Phytomonospora endophytica]MBB6035182.1 hypothetical protein [Phytomonospora endophytica]GIG64069.1 hypothetical protein Pen01_03640 [Phytomonospora endophytica]